VRSVESVIIVFKLGRRPMNALRRLMVVEESSHIKADKINFKINVSIVEDRVTSQPTAGRNQRTKARGLNGSGLNGSKRTSQPVRWELPLKPAAAM
jgi:hypothetical protein